MKNPLRYKFSIPQIVFFFMVLFPVLVFADQYTEMNTPVKTEAGEEDAWTGIDVSIVGKYAEKYGRPPRDPYINTDQGDLLLFVFTLAGVVGGFVMGFNARKLFFEKDKNS